MYYNIMTFKVNYIGGNFTSQLYRLITFDMWIVFKRNDNKAWLLSIVIKWGAWGSVSRGNGQSTIVSGQFFVREILCYSPCFLLSKILTVSQKPLESACHKYCIFNGSNLWFQVYQECIWDVVLKGNAYIPQPMKNVGIFKMLNW